MIALSASGRAIGILAIGILAFSAAFSGGALAQHQGQHESQPQSAYAGFETRSIKALSESQLADLKAGRGMGLALAAELNGYPGPSHALELADKLALAPEQRARMQALMQAMKQETIAIGEEVIAAETALDRLFAQQRADASSLAQAMKTLAEAQGRLRAAHLRYHLDTRATLTLEQIAGYAQLRGYTKGLQ